MNDQDPKIVIFGGGTGLSSILRGLKKYPVDITAVVTVGDDGGSSGRLRKMFNMTPPGDIRRVLISLSKEEELFSDLFNYRFTDEGDLDGHTVGNIILAALSNMNEGDMTKAITYLGKVLNIKGQIIPISKDPITLVAEYDDESIEIGESNIPCAHKTIQKIYNLHPDIVANEEVIKKIIEADLIIYSAGSLFTSLLPNLLYQEVISALKKSKAKKIYIANIMTQPGETSHYKLSDHVKTLLSYIEKENLDYVLANNDLNIDDEILKRYLNDGASLVIPDTYEVESLGIKVLTNNLLKVEGCYIRHDHKKNAAQIFRLLLN